MNKNTIFFSSNLITNFKPNTNYSSLSLIKNKKSKNSQIYCKNFLIYLLILKSKKKLFHKNEIFIKKFKKKVYTILKAPYRYKIARHQISLNRYNINFSSHIKINKSINIKKWEQLILIFKFLKLFDSILESNLMFTNSLKFKLPFIYKNNFNITNFKKNDKLKIIK